jgi:UDP-glucuronate 4-epimerase
VEEHILITGGAGFIGSHVVKRLLALGYKVTCIDNFDPFYSYYQKYHNLKDLIKNQNLNFINEDITDLQSIFERIKFTDFSAIIHLAAKAGVRPSILDPIAYQDTNVKGTQNMLEIARIKKIAHFVFASSSSVYGINPKFPWSETDTDVFPISPYAATKISGELLGHVYSHLYNLRFVALRFFTVYGPSQRPDLAIHKFVKNIYEGNEITLYGNGLTARDYTYVDDTVDGIIAALHYRDSLYEIINLGNQQTVTLNELVECIQNISGREVKIARDAEQPGDVPITYANIDKAKALLGYEPKVKLEEGISRFCNWYEDYYFSDTKLIANGY